MEDWRNSLTDDDNSVRQDRLPFLLRHMKRGPAIRRELVENPQSGLWEIREKLKKHRVRQQRWIYLITSSAAMIAIGIFLLWITQTETAVHTISSIQSPTHPKFRADLITDKGEVFSIQNDVNQVILADRWGAYKVENNTMVVEQGKATDTLRYSTLRVPRGAEYPLILPDGTKVYLNSGSELTFPSAFIGNVREVWLEGEAFFEVIPDASKEFIVRTKEVAAVVLGTSFNINAYPEQKRQTTTLASGKLKVICSEKEYILQPGNQLQYDINEQQAILRTVDPELYTSWKDGEYYFLGMRLEEIMTSISYWYDLQVEFLDQETKDFVFSGRLKRYEEATTLLERFRETKTIDFSQTDNKITIRKNNGSKNR